MRLGACRRRRWCRAATPVPLSSFSVRDADSDAESEPDGSSVALWLGPIQPVVMGSRLTPSCLQLTDADGDVLRLEILFFALTGVLQALCRGRAKVVSLTQTRRDRFAVTCRETWICWRNLRMRCEEQRTRTVAVSGWGSGAGDQAVWDILGGDEEIGRKGEKDSEDVHCAR